MIYLDLKKKMIKICSIIKYSEIGCYAINYRKYIDDNGLEGAIEIYEFLDRIGN